MLKLTSSLPTINNKSSLSIAAKAGIILAAILVLIIILLGLLFLLRRLRHRKQQQQQLSEKQNIENANFESSTQAPAAITHEKPSQAILQEREMPADPITHISEAPFINQNKTEIQQTRDDTNNATYGSEPLPQESSR